MEKSNDIQSLSVSSTIQNLERTYKNSKKEVQIGRDLIAPCLRECVRYRRGTGTFSSSVLKTYILAIEEIISNNTKIEILCSPKIDITLFNALITFTDEIEREKKINEFLNDFIGEAAGIQRDLRDKDYVEKIICYLISNKILDIRFAIPVKNIEIESLIFSENEEASFNNLATRNMYHIKQGYFEFKGGEIVGFDGSVNETDTALSFNQEKARVWKSWVDSHREDLQELVDDVDLDWGAFEDRKNENIRIYPIGKKILEIIKTQSPTERPKNPKEPSPPSPDNFKSKDEFKYRHQKEAVETFMLKKNGILNMATGTGKTRTALKIINQLTKENLIDQFIVTCYGKDLLAQWHQILIDSNDDQSSEITKNYQRILFRKEGRKKFELNPHKAGLLTSIDDVYLLEDLDEKLLERTLIIYDEVHNLGTETRINKLSKLNKNIFYRLGLSATPDKGEFNLEMTNAIQSQIGDIIFKFDLKDAIERGILCEFDYKTLDYSLSKEDRDKFKKIQGLRAARKKEGNPMSSEEFARLLANVYKQSETKLLSFDQFLRNDKSILKSTIVFVPTEDYGTKVMAILKEYTSSYRTYYGDSDKSILDDFINNKIDMLITCKAISQGIDIPELQNIVLFSSDKNLGETIQRLGRCLRNPSSSERKIAKVVDFNEIREDDIESYDYVRVNWLNELSQTKEMRNA